MVDSTKIKSNWQTLDERLSAMSETVSNSLTCGEAIAQLLKDYEVDTVFGIPGVHTLEIYRGIAGSGIRHVLARNESGAGFMADGYARATGKPGVCIVISGPGVTNVATPLGQAYHASVPVLVISSVTRSGSLGKGWGDAHEISEQLAVTKPLTRLSTRIEELDQVSGGFSQAFEILTSGRPRPVHIELPIDLLTSHSTRFDVVPHVQSDEKLFSSVCPQTYELASKLLKEAENPIILAGGGCKGSKRIISLIEKLRSPVVTSNAGKGVLPEDHPLSLGCSVSRAAVLERISRADVVLALGTELSDADNFTLGLPIDGQLIRVDLDPSKLNDRYPATVAINNRVDEFCSQISLMLKSWESQSDECERHKEVQEILGRAFVPEYEAEVAHLAALKSLRLALPTGSLVFADMAQIAYSGCFGYQCFAENEWHFAGGFGALGASLPQAIGAKVANSSANVACLIGDGGLMFTLPELMVAVELKLNIPIIVWENLGFAEIRDEMNRRGISAFAVEPTMPNLAKLSQSFGCKYEKVQGPKALEEVISVALEGTLPTIVHVNEREFFV